VKIADGNRDSDIVGSALGEMRVPASLGNVRGDSDRQNYERKTLIRPFRKIFDDLD